MILFTLMLACTKGDDAPVDTGDGPGELLLSPTTVDFGTLPLAEGPATALVTAENIGRGPLNPDSLALITAPDVSVTGWEDPLEPGASVQVELTFAPLEDTELEGKLTLVSTVDQATVDLVGHLQAPRLELSPPDSVEVAWGCTELSELQAANTGSLPLELELTESLESVWLSVFPSPIGPGEAVTIGLQYTPVSDGDDLLDLRVESNDPQRMSETIEIPLSAQAGEPASDVFELASESSVDMLVVVDHSSGVDALLVNVLEGLEALALLWETEGLDYQLAVAYTDDGCVIGDWLTPGLAESTRTARIEAMGCERPSTDGAICYSSGSNIERGFTIAEAALGEIGAGGCNEGLVRDEAELALLFVSDEPEQSTEPYTYYVDYYWSLKDEPDDVRVHGIGGDYPSGCGNAQSFDGVYEATVLTGGILESVCGDLEVRFPAVGQEHLEPRGETDFPLSQTPVDGSISVTVDETERSDWAWEAESNAVTFEEAMPGGSTVGIAYSVQPEC